MSTISRHRWRIGIPGVLILLALLVSLAFTFSSRAFSHAAIAGSHVISIDPFHNKSSQHQAEVEPDSFAFGNTVVTAMQQGRFWDGGGSDIGFATSTDGGHTFVHGSLPGLTVYSTPAGPYARASDASVAYDPRHKVWLISSLGIVTPAGPVDVVVNRSTDGGLHWSAAVPVNKTGRFNDKNWTTCDDTPSSPFYGNCYTEFDNASAGDQIQMSTSTDGGKTWGPAKTTANHDFGIGGQPLVQPSGRVIVPIIGFVVNATQPFIMNSFISDDGGKTWSTTFKITPIRAHVPEGGIRADIPLPSAEIDAAGRVYLVWSDCRFEPGCRYNDIVLSTSTDGIHWTGPKRIPIDRIGSTVDHFVPGIAVDRTTAGGSAHIGLAFNYYPVFNCQPLTCHLTVGFVSSTNGGASWSASQRISPSMYVEFLPLTTQGFMFGDYISTSIVAGSADANPFYDEAGVPTGTPQKSLTCTDRGVTCHVATYTASLSITGGTNAAGDNEATYTPTSGKKLTAPPTAY
jgi:hypothetical protein